MTTGEGLKTTFHSIFKTQRSGRHERDCSVLRIVSGAIAALMMFVTIPFIGRIPFEYLTVIGYTTFVACFVMVFVGIRSYRDKVAGGTITFGRGFKVGILITLISCGIYIIAWEFIYHRFLPDFLDQYSNYVVEKMRAQGATPEALNQTIQEYEQFKEWYRILSCATP